MAMPKKINAGIVTAVAKKQRHGGHFADIYAWRVCRHSCVYAAPRSSRGRAPMAVKRWDSTGMMKEANLLEERTWSITRGKSAERNTIATVAMAQESGRPMAARESVQAAMSTAKPVSGGGTGAEERDAAADVELNERYLEFGM
jgi:hypothetical protein